MADKAGFQAWVVEQRDHALIIPATERTLTPLHQIRGLPELADRLALPPPSATIAGFDKERVRALAEQLGIPVPANLVIESVAELASPVLDGWLEHGAIVIKSVHSKVWGQRGGRELAVQMVVDREQLEIFAGQLLENSPVQLQQWVPGHGRGIEVLVDHGEIVLAFAHERLHEVPLTGGGSSYRHAIEPPAELLDAARRLLRALGWHGVAMVEFRYDPLSGRSYMMELNGRFWGSLPLAQFAGVDFPRALVELLLDRKRPAPAIVKRPAYARAFQRDLRWLRQMARVRVADLRRVGPIPHERRLILVRPIVRSVVEWGRLATGREVWDGAAFDDLAPIAFEVTQQVEAARDWLVHAWKRRRMRREAIAAWSRPLPEVRNVLVVCTGNICRSAYTYVKLGSAVSGSGITVRSRALEGPSGRPSPTFFATVARGRGIELAAHRSQAITAADLAWADLILLMEDEHHRALAAYGPEVLAKARWLGAAVTTDDPVIPDPIDYGTAQLLGFLDRMDEAIAAVVTRIG
jgi:protein-tyrosine-phosphatase/glutathione synthase/RimK-type ligase-like ATP-grasp enzyme